MPLYPAELTFRLLNTSDFLLQDGQPFRLPQSAIALACAVSCTASAVFACLHLCALYGVQATLQSINICSGVLFPDAHVAAVRLRQLVQAAFYSFVAIFEAARGHPAYLLEKHAQLGHFSWKRMEEKVRSHARDTHTFLEKARQALRTLNQPSPNSVNSLIKFLAAPIIQKDQLLAQAREDFEKARANYADYQNIAQKINLRPIPWAGEEVAVSLQNAPLVIEELRKNVFLFYQQSVQALSQELQGIFDDLTAKLITIEEASLRIQQAGKTRQELLPAAPAFKSLLPWKDEAELLQKIAEISSELPVLEWFPCCIIPDFPVEIWEQFLKRSSLNDLFKLRFLNERYRQQIDEYLCRVQCLDPTLDWARIKLSFICLRQDMVACQEFIPAHWLIPQQGSVLIGFLNYLKEISTADLLYFIEKMQAKNKIPKNLLNFIHRTLRFHRCTPTNRPLQALTSLQRDWSYRNDPRFLEILCFHAKSPTQVFHNSNLSVLPGMPVVLRRLYRDRFTLNGGNTLTHWAATLEDKVSCLRELREAGATFEERNDRKETPLHLVASKSQKGPALTFLLECGVKADVRDSEDKTPLQRCSELINAGLLLNYRCEIMADLLVYHYKDHIFTKEDRISVLEGEKLKTFLSWAGFYKRLDVIKIILPTCIEIPIEDLLELLCYVPKERPILLLLAQLGLRFRNRETMAHWAVEIGRLDVLQAFYQAGHSLEETNDKQETPLHLAVMGWPKMDVLDFLLRSGVKADARDREGKTPLERCFENEDEQFIFLVHSETVASLLVYQYKDHLPSKEERVSLFIKRRLKRFISCFTDTKKYAALKIILQMHADVPIEDLFNITPYSSHFDGAVLAAQLGLKFRNGDTMAHWAAREGRLDVLKACHSFEEKNDQQETPLHFAVERPLTITVLDFLLSQGVQAGVQDGDGKTPFQRSSTYETLSALIIYQYKDKPLPKEKFIPEQLDRFVLWARTQKKSEVLKIINQAYADIPIEELIKLSPQLFFLRRAFTKTRESDLDTINGRVQ